MSHLSLEILKAILDVLGLLLRSFFASENQKRKALKGLELAQSRLDAIFNRFSLDLTCVHQEDNALFLELGDSLDHPEKLHLASEKEPKPQAKSLVIPEAKKRIKHRLGPPIDCPLCRQKLELAHPRLKRIVRHLFIDFEEFRPHVSWTYRGPLQQKIAFDTGHSFAPPGKSPHNHRNPETNKEESLAVDLFQLSACGSKAEYEKAFFSELASWARFHRHPVLWGGHFQSEKGKKLGDYSHFELVPALMEAEKTIAHVV